MSRRQRELTGTLAAWREWCQKQEPGVVANLYKLARSSYDGYVQAREKAFALGAPMDIDDTEIDGATHRCRRRVPPRSGWWVGYFQKAQPVSQEAAIDAWLDDEPVYHGISDREMMCPSHEVLIYNAPYLITSRFIKEGGVWKSRTPKRGAA